MRPLLWTSLLASVTVTGGCKKEKPFAPTEMTEILTFMFENFDDPESMGAASDNLKPWLDDNADTEEIINGYQMNPLTEKVASAVDYPPNAVLSDQLGAVTGNLSSYPLDDQAIVMVQNDQSFLNTDSYIKYKRDVSGNVNQFKSGSGLIETDNDVETKVVAWTTPYNLKKDYRWVEGEESRSIVARSWIEEEGCNEGGALDICLLQSFSVDVFMDDGKRTQRLTATWAEVKPDVLSDKQLTDQLIDGVQTVFESEDAWIFGNL